VSDELSEASPLRRREIIDALRIGAVPRRGLELFAVGLERFEKAIDEELATVAAGQGRFKAVRGEYGTGKTFFARWLEHRALQAGFGTTLVQISPVELRRVHALGLTVLGVHAPIVGADWGCRASSVRHVARWVRREGTPMCATPHDRQPRAEARLPIASVMNAQPERLAVVPRPTRPNHR